MSTSESSQRTATESNSVSPSVHFDLMAEASALRESAFWQHGKHTARTLSMHPDFRLVLMVLRSGSRLHAHKTDHAISVQTLTGHVVLNLPERTIELPTGSVVLLDRSVIHDVVAMADSTLLLSLSGSGSGGQPRARAHGLELIAEEHRRFSKLLDLLTAQLELFHRGEQPDYDLLEDVFFYMINYPDRFHHPKEELLFSKIAEHVPSVRAHVAELGRQHRQIAAAGTRFLDNLQSVLNDGLLTRQAVEQPALEYISLYRAHLALEEQEILPLGQKYLRPDDWAKIDAAVKTEEDPLFGSLIEQRYLTLHRQLAAEPA
jgi:hemerythrin-like domain-containing protein/quercetin dioxygenase-like cupin family protein